MYNRGKAASPARAYPAPPALRRHEKFYIDLIYLKVDSCLFAVPRRALTQDASGNPTFFRNGILLADRVGSSESTAVPLNQVTEREFECFLEVVAPPEPNAPVTLSTDDWIVVLKLANLWSFPSLCEGAKRELEGRDLSPIRRIELTRQYPSQLDSWLENAYLELVQRPESITMAEAHCLGLESVVKLAQLRDTYATARQHPSSASSLINADTWSDEDDIAAQQQEQELRCSVRNVFSLPDNTRCDSPVSASASQLPDDPDESGSVSVVPSDFGRAITTPDGPDESGSVSVVPSDFDSASIAPVGPDDSGSVGIVPSDFGSASTAPDDIPSPALSKQRVSLVSRSVSGGKKKKGKKK